MKSPGSEYAARTIEKEMRLIGGEDIHYEDWIVGVGSSMVALGILEPSIYPKGSIHSTNQLEVPSRQIAEDVEGYFKGSGCKHHPEANSALNPNIISIYYLKL